jgi:uncharacterized repeat protein (TIGR01451 family)
MRNIFTLFALLMATRAFSLDPTHFTITRITAPYFVVDGNAPTTITKAYVGFEVKNTSVVTYTGLKFTITSIGTSVAGQNYSIASPASGIVNVGTLAPGQSKVCYYYVSYPASTTPQATFNTQLTDNTTGNKTQSFVIRNRSSISANAGGTATQSFTNQDLIGGIIIDDVTYVVGNVQNGDENDFQVSVAAQFDPAKMSLLSTQVISSSVPGITAGTTDSLYFISGNGTNGATVTVRWTFRIAGFNFTSYILPCAGATSGSTNYKYALNTSLGAGTPVTVSAAANPLLITKTSDKSWYAINSTATFTITITNPGAFGVTIDRITDELPAGFVFQSFHVSSDVIGTNSTTAPLAGATGNISFEGSVASGVNTSYYIPAGGNIIVRYTATTPASSAFDLQTTARDFIGTTEVGNATNTVSVSATLPVTLLSFDAVKENRKTAKLTWKTASETNSSVFEVEKSVNNGSFVKTGEVIAAGSSATPVTYSFVDSLSPNAITGYRLKMIDRDGRYEYSRVVSLQTKQDGFVLQRVYPNPVSSATRISAISDKETAMRWQLLDVDGRVLINKTERCMKGQNEFAIPGIEKLQSGVYLLRVFVDGSSKEERLLKVR